MKDVLAFIERTIDRAALWFWLATAALVLVLWNHLFKSPSVEVSRYGVISVGLFAALFFQSQPVRSRMGQWISEQREERKKMKERREILSYVLRTPCREHVVLTAYCDYWRPEAKCQLDKQVVRTFFFDANDQPTKFFRLLARKRLAEENAQIGRPIVHEWVKRAFMKQLTSKKENEVRRTCERLNRYGCPLLEISEISDMFVHEMHVEKIRELEGGA